MQNREQATGVSRKLMRTVLAGWLSLFAVVSCNSDLNETSQAKSPVPNTGMEKERKELRQTLAREGINDTRVLDVMNKVPRHLFVPDKLRAMAYANIALPIAAEQTISQPYVVAFMTEALKVKRGDRVLEVGTGSGYQAAVLAELVKEVYSIEIIDKLAQSASALLKKLGYNNVYVKSGDGYRGWPEKAPFDAIIVTAAPDHIPQPLIDQLATGGRLIVPVGKDNQELILITKTKNGITSEKVLPVRFVPMTGESQTLKTTPAK